MTRVLLVSPRFHGYWRSIATALRHAGHDVRPHLYDARTPARLVAHKLGTELPTRLGIADDARVDVVATRRLVRLLREDRPDAVVVVRGDTLGPELWAELDALRVPRVLWLYDEVRRTAWTTQALASTGPVASYSALDAAALGARYLPLAFDPALDLAFDPGVAGVGGVGDVPRRDEVVFVGARYPSREHVLTALQRAGVPVRVHGRDWSRHPVDRLRTWGGRRPDLPAGRDVTREEAYRLMAGATGALNLHGDQDGFTMRTFEASGVGGLQLLDRTDVGDLYEPDVELLTFSATAELVEHVQRARRDRGWADAIREKGRARTLAEHTFGHRVAVLEELWSSWG